MTLVAKPLFLLHPTLPSYRRRSLRPGVIRLPKLIPSDRNPARYLPLVCCATYAAGSADAMSDENPYEVLGVSPNAGFHAIKAAYARRLTEAEGQGEASFARLERAYDMIMMSQLTYRKKGLVSESFQVSKNIKYADNQPIVSWGPRYSMSSVKDLNINKAISAVFTILAVFMRNAEYKPLQFLAFIFFYRIFEKLKAFEPALPPKLNEYGEDDGRALRLGKRVLRSSFFVFGCISASSLTYTGILNLIEYLGYYIPVFLYNNQELIVTATSALLFYFTASYYR